MEAVELNNTIIQEMTQLLEKTSVESFAPVITETASDEQTLEAILISLKTINARYDKNDAIVQIRGLMEKYNIQIDEILEQIKY
ncbi:hypothetical protein [Chryseosolibacter indicus]|uniref:Uncharacterized protein n=1 Tax=Chryseosolibacter indicus TaxID=2782351 RepID=A0ABS5VRK3_9BACT|nr:hypothetical protein [Chryseosolibacter indicus]MBT1703658.1 hypothetical protein [Chryseosolibacter indicus]